MTIMENETYDAGIILGHFYSGYSLTSRQIKRLNKGVQLFKEGKVNCLIVTGGKGMFNKNSPPLATLAKNFLVINGVQEKKIFYDEHSVNTVENAKFSLEIMKKNHLNSAVIITSADHMSRAINTFRKIYPESISLKGEISDSFAGIWSFFDFFWNFGGNTKRFLQGLRNS